MTRFSLAGIVASLLIASTSAWAGTIDTPKDGLPPDLAVGKVDLTLVIRNITKAQHDALKADPNLLDNLKIFLPAFDASTKVAATEAEATDAVPFYLTFWGDSDLDAPPSADNTYTHTLLVSIIEKVGGKLKEKYETASMEIRITYEDKDGNKVAGEQAFTLVREIFAIKDAPAFQEPAVIGSHKQLRPFWIHRTEVAAEGSTALKEPKRTNIYVVEKATATNPDAPTTLTLPAKKFNVTTGVTADVVTCTYTAPAGDTGNCVSCDDPLVYLDQTAIAAAVANQTLPGLKVVKTSSSNEAGTVTGLDNEKEYFVFLQWEPGGLKTSECVSGKPSPNFSLTELNGEDGARVVDFRCFIATAAYGTPLHDDIALFRSFRDDVLMPTLPGRLLVSTYYAVSPVIADYISDHPVLKAWVRARLEKVARWLRSESESR